MAWRWSHPTRGAWIEIVNGQHLGHALASHPTRGAWIEILKSGKKFGLIYVAPHTGCVD